MALTSELFSLGVYVLQQLGMLLGVGAQTVLSVLYLATLASAAPRQHIAGARATKRIGLGIIVASGFGALALHVWFGQEAIVYAPAFIFKWMLIAGLLAFYFLEQADNSKDFMQHAARGFMGAHWYALLLVHLVPVANWLVLLLFYVAWLAVFMLGWTVFGMLMRPHWVRLPAFAFKKPPAAAVLPAAAPTAILKPVAPAPRVAVVVPKKVAPVMPEPRAPLPVVFAEELPSPPAPKTPPAPLRATPAPLPPKVAPAPKPPIAPPTLASKVEAIDFNKAPTIPAIRVMPRTPQELEQQNRATVVQFT